NETGCKLRCFFVRVCVRPVVVCLVLDPRCLCRVQSCSLIRLGTHLLPLSDFCYLTLDPNTAHHQLILSEKNRAVTHNRTDQPYSDQPERFDTWSQVLCKESVCGRCYWEVEWSNFVSISVSYKEISRKGQGYECLFGYNSQSWSLQCSSSSVYFFHNKINTELQVPASSRIGVYVDHSAGTLSFYSISDTMKLLHRFHTTFTQPLYAGFCMWRYDSTVRFCDLK
ncbi:stonustoxin subunit beta, partial [Ictalurus punctatus]|uniref:Stonustoxin subunit beta n=1 Tax=Ictalurus punctatus TaxID=7998 RepID=A0A9F7RJJ6_ICTPU